MPQRLCLFFLVAISVLEASAQPSISQVWVKPDNPTKGGAISFLLLGTFDSKTVVATLFGPGCDKGCELQINGEKTSDRLSGSLSISSAGAFQIEVRNGDGPASKRQPFCTVAVPRIARIWTRPDPPDPDSPFEIGIVGGGFDSASVTGLLANAACIKNTCGAISMESKSFDYLAGKAPALPGGHYAVAVKNAVDAPFAEAELTVTPKLEQLVTNPATPARNITFQFTLTGKGFWPGQSRILVFHPTLCPQGCSPTGWKILQSTATQIEGNMLLAQPGTFEVGIESAGVMSKRVKLEVK